VYQYSERPEALFGHVFGEPTGFLVTFTGKQARFTCDGARPNELAATRQRSWSYLARCDDAAAYLLHESSEGRDAYFGVHLFLTSGSRRRTNAASEVRCLWLDEDDGRFPDKGPEPTAIVRSSASRRHLYWRLERPIPTEEAIRLNRRLAAFSGGDIGKAAASSVLRAPGTKNYKRHPEVDAVVLELTGAPAWSPEVLDQALPLEPGPSAPPIRDPYVGPAMELEEFLHDVQVITEVSDTLGRKFLIVCPWVHEHSGDDRTGTRVGQRVGGGLWFHCDHAHCEGRTWQDFRRMVGRSRFVEVDMHGFSRPETLNVRIRYGG
jgi:hypothetical protein